MRLASYRTGTGTGVGLVDGDELRPLPGLTELGPQTDFGSLPQLAEHAGDALPLSSVDLRPVVPRPERVICLGLNYRAHVEETKRELPTYPVLFAKWASTLTAAGAPIALPGESTQVDFEAELAVVIGRRGRRIPRAEALSHVAGYTIANDVTMRDYQYKTHQWLQGKAWDRSTPVGPWLVTADELPDPGQLDLSLRLNGELMQSSNTNRMIFDVATIVATISEFTELSPGDLLLTGTPGGVGYRRDPQVLLQPGDDVTVEIEGIGTMTNAVVAEHQGALV